MIETDKVKQKIHLALSSYHKIITMTNNECPDEAMCNKIKNEITCQYTEYIYQLTKK
jgi:hypothetical protein